MSTRSCSVRWTRPPHTCRVTSAGRPTAAHGGGAGCWSRFPCGAEARGQSVRTLSAETHRQAVPCVCVLFPPPARAVVLMVPSVANRRPHGSAAHRAVAATLSVVVGAFHGQFHAIVLLERERGLEHTDHEVERHNTQQEPTATHHCCGRLALNSLSSTRATGFSSALLLMGLRRSLQGQGHLGKTCRVN